MRETQREALDFLVYMAAKAFDYMVPAAMPSYSMACKCRADLADLRDALKQVEKDFPGVLSEETQEEVHYVLENSDDIIT